MMLMGPALSVQGMTVCHSVSVTVRECVLVRVNVCDSVCVTVRDCL